MKVKINPFQTRQVGSKQHGVYEVDYHWQDGYGNWHRETVPVVADSGDSAMELAQSTVYMPYGANGAEFCGEA